MPKQSDITVFYSWQTDLPTETNNRAIATCIKKAFLTIEENDALLKLELDEATRGEPGSPEIPETILNKITSADIFICDVTTINNSDTADKKTPNPNVMLELGFAVATLGWDRIVMLYNKNYGNFPIDIPFDLNKRRVTSFIIKNKSDNQGKTQLVSTLIAAISTIIKKNPIKPLEQKLNSEDEIKRTKDIANLKNLFTNIHIGTIDRFIDELPYKIIGRIYSFWHPFNAVYESNSFHLYDYKINQIIEKFKRTWDRILNYDHFVPSTNGQDYIYYIPMDEFPNERSEKDFSLLRRDSIKLQREFKILVNHMRYNYLEIDIDNLSNSALERCLENEKELQEDLLRMKMQS